jgi:hypothetical protein
MEISETVLTLEEEDPTEAASFLLELIKISQSESKRRTRFWNKSWAQLSTKWLVSEYVTMYAALGSKHIAMMLYNSPPKNHGAFEIYGATNSFADEINGMYEWTDNMMEGGMPLYKKKQSEDEIIVQNDEKTKSWLISHSDSRGTSKFYASLLSKPALTPDNNPEGNWKSWDDENNLLRMENIKVRKVATGPCPNKEDLSLFWEIIDTMFQFEPLRKGPITSMEQLIEELAMSHYLWDEKPMMSMLTPADWFCLSGKLRNKALH